MHLSSGQECQIAGVSCDEQGRAIEKLRKKVVLPGKRNASSEPALNFVKLLGNGLLYVRGSLTESLVHLGNGD